MLSLKVDKHGKYDITSEANWTLLKYDRHRLPNEQILGASANTFLLGMFLYNSKLRASMDGKPESLPGGLACWKEICEALYVTLPSFLSVSELAARVMLLVDEFCAEEAAVAAAAAVSAATSTASSSSSSSSLSPAPSSSSSAAARMPLLPPYPLSSQNLLSGALSFLHEWLRGHHVYLGECLTPATQTSTHRISQ